MMTHAMATVPSSARARETRMSLAAAVVSLVYYCSMACCDTAMYINVQGRIASSRNILQTVNGPFIVDPSYPLCSELMLCEREGTSSSLRGGLNLLYYECLMAVLKRSERFLFYDIQGHRSRLQGASRGKVR